MGVANENYDYLWFIYIQSVSVFSIIRVLSHFQLNKQSLPRIKSYFTQQSMKKKIINNLVHFTLNTPDCWRQRTLWINNNLFCLRRHFFSVLKSVLLSNFCTSVTFVEIINNTPCLIALSFHVYIDQIEWQSFLDPLNSLNVHHFFCHLLNCKKCDSKLNSIKFGVVNRVNMMKWIIYYVLIENYKMWMTNEKKNNEPIRIEEKKNM